MTINKRQRELAVALAERLGRTCEKAQVEALAAEDALGQLEDREARRATRQASRSAQMPTRA